MNLTNKELADMLRDIADGVERCRNNKVTVFSFRTNTEQLPHQYEVFQTYVGNEVELKIKVW